MDWIVFGDDWGAHPSTTQHLIKNLPAEDRIVWIDSIGMRSPKLNAADARRVMRKLGEMTKIGGAPAAKASAKTAPETAEDRVFRRIRPKIAPFHMNAVARGANQRLLSRAIGGALAEIGARDPVVLSSTPVAEAYLDALPFTRLAYLRLDDYARLPGVDAELIAHFEPRIYDRADIVVATAKPLLPPPPWEAKGRYLPQGVSWEHFAQAPLEPQGKPVLGFFGLMAEWLDHELIVALARLKPDWTLRFIGAQRFVHPDLAAQPNVELLPAAPFSALPQMVGDWSAAWIPFELSELTRGVNPLKLREYLAAGLPTHSTPLPESVEAARGADIFVTADAQALSAWLDETLATDTVAARRARRDSVAGDSWRSRSAELRRLLSPQQVERAAS